MKTKRLFAVIVCLIAWVSWAAAQSESPDAVKLLDHLAGTWVLKGTIGGKQTTHDVEARWVLRREYLQIHEVSREKNAGGEPAYEAIILVTWEPKTNQYACLWMDSTAGGALTSPVTCRATPSVNRIPFLFTISPSQSIHTTFTYTAAGDVWAWTIDDETKGTIDRFADVKLTRAR